MFKKYIYVSGVFSVIIPYVAAGGWYVVSSCPAPCAEPRGLTGLGDYLVGDGPIPQVFVINPKTGSVASSFPAPGGPGAWGITAVPHEDTLYLSNNLNSWIYKITTMGSVLSSFLCPLPGPAGIDYGWPPRLEVTIPSMNVVAALDLEEGYLISAFRGPGLKPTSCFGDNWALVGDAGTHAVYVRIYRDPFITGIETPSGLIQYNYIKGRDTYPTKGLFVVDAATKYIYNYEDDAPVAPASLGRIKALFE